jgi:hypothetical protein
LARHKQRQHPIEVVQIDLQRDLTILLPAATAGAPTGEMSGNVGVEHDQVDACLLPTAKARRKRRPAMRTNKDDGERLPVCPPSKNLPEPSEPT